MRKNVFKITHFALDLDKIMNFIQSLKKLFNYHYVFILAIGTLIQCVYNQGAVYLTSV